MSRGLKVTFSLFVAVLVALGLLSFPFLDEITQTCTGSLFCGAHLKNSLDYLNQTDVAALAFGKFLYNKFITGIITFIFILTFSTIAHRIYTKFK